MSKERWLPIVGFEGFYEVSDHGRVRSVDRVLMCVNRWGQIAPRKYTGKIIAPGRVRAYLQVHLQRKGNEAVQTVHRAVLTAFQGPCPPGMQGAHIDGNPENNHISNLAWKTPHENYLDKEKHGTVFRGDKNPTAKLSEAQAQEIRELVKTGMPQWRIGEKFGVCQQHISNILLRKRRALS